MVHLLELILQFWVFRWYTSGGTISNLCIIGAILLELLNHLFPAFPGLILFSDRDLKRILTIDVLTR